MKRAVIIHERRRLLQRLSLAAALGATTVLGSFGWADDGSLGSYFSTKTAKRQPAPIKNSAELKSPSARSAALIQASAEAEAKRAEAKKPAQTSGTRQGLSGYFAKSKRKQAASNQGPPGTRVTLSKTKQPPHVKPAPFSSGDEARPLQREKTNAFLDNSRINRYSEPRTLTRPPAKPLGADEVAKPSTKPNAPYVAAKVLPPVVSPQPLKKPTPAPIVQPNRGIAQAPAPSKQQPATAAPNFQIRLPSKRAAKTEQPKLAKAPRVAPPTLETLKPTTAPAKSGDPQSPATTLAKTEATKPSKSAYEPRVEPKKPVTLTPTDIAARKPAAASVAKTTTRPKDFSSPITPQSPRRQSVASQSEPEKPTPAATIRPSQLPSLYAQAPVAGPKPAPRSNGVTPVRNASNSRAQQAKPEAPAKPKFDSLAKLLNRRKAARTQNVRLAQAQESQPNIAPQINPDSPFEIIDEAGRMTIEAGRSRLLKCKVGVFRTAIVEPSIVEAIQFTPTEISLIGKKVGATQVTFWFEDDKEAPQTYLIEVQPSERNRSTVQRRYDHLEDLLAELFPDSKVRLRLVADKLIVRGQAKDSAEAAQIMSIVRAQAGTGGGMGGGQMGLGAGSAARVLLPSEAPGQAQSNIQVINMLQVPGVQQVALRVKIAELSRTAARGAGIDLDADIEINGNEGALLLQSMLNVGAGNAPALIGQIDNNQLEIGLRWLQQNGVVRVVSEPTLVTLSGTAATFVAGGEFAVPTVVGTGGLSAVTTDFRAFGAIISFMPTIVDKDRIRLQVSPEFSKINTDLNVGGTPGLQVRAVTTTVEMREGQTLAIAGLLDESLTSDRSSNLPWLERIVGTRDTSRNETELIILVTPELVHPMDPEEVPPLPGFDVTEPTDKEFFYHGRLEGHPARQHRSTVWPRLRRRYGAGGSSMISGPFGHGQ